MQFIRSVLLYGKFAKMQISCDVAFSVSVCVCVCMFWLC